MHYRHCRPVFLFLVLTSLVGSRSMSVVATSAVGQLSGTDLT
jgi:hypothetical protein